MICEQTVAEHSLSGDGNRASSTSPENPYHTQHEALRPQQPPHSPSHSPPSQLAAEGEDDLTDDDEFGHDDDGTFVTAAFATSPARPAFSAQQQQDVLAAVRICPYDR